MLDIERTVIHTTSPALLAFAIWSSTSELEVTDPWEVKASSQDRRSLGRTKIFKRSVDRQWSRLCRDSHARMAEKAARGAVRGCQYMYMVVVQYSCLLKRPFFAAKKKRKTFAKLSRTLCVSFAGVHHLLTPLYKPCRDWISKYKCTECFWFSRRMLQTGKWCWSRISLAHVVRESICTRTLDDEVCGVAMGYGVPLEPIHSPKPSPDFRETFAK